MYYGVWTCVIEIWCNIEFLYRVYLGVHYTASGCTKNPGNSVLSIDLILNLIWSIRIKGCTSISGDVFLVWCFYAQCTRVAHKFEM